MKRGINNGRRSAVILAAVAAVAMPPSVLADTIAYSDGTLSLSNWSVTQQGGGTAVDFHQTTGGNPNEFLRVEHQNFSGIIYSYHRNSAATYDPATQGPIDTIEFSVDLCAIQNFNDTNILFYPLIRQNGVNYFAPTYFINSGLGTWDTHATLSLQASDFGELTHSPSGTPLDFSAAGGVMELGFNCSNDNGSSSATRIAGVDNWSLKLHQLRYWDVNGATAGAGGATPHGTWNTGNNNWTASAAGTAATAAWTTGDGASFSAGTDAGGAYTVTVSGTQSASGLTFKDGTATLSGGTVMLADGNRVTVAAGATATINSIVSGSLGLTKMGSGTLVLGGANTFDTTFPTTLKIPRAVVVKAGTLRVDFDDRLGVPANDVILDGGTLETTNDITPAAGRTFMVGPDGGTFAPAAGKTLTITTAVNDSPSGGGALTKSGDGKLALLGSNNFIGNIIINAGILRINGVSGLGNGSNSVLINGGTLETAGTFGSGIGHFITLGAAGGTFATASGTFTSVQPIVGPGALTKTGAGTLLLANNNSWNGSTNINEGTLTVNSNNQIPQIPLNVAGGTLSISNLNQTVGAVTLTSLGLISSTTGVLTATSYAVESGSITAKLSGIGALTKSTTGTVTLSGANTYSGGTSINEGILAITTDAALNNSTTGVSFGGGTLQFKNYSSSLAFNSSAIRALGAATGTASTLSGVISGAGGLTYSGPGTLVLTGANTYIGATTVSAGTLLVNNSATGEGNMTVASGATLGGTGTIHNVANTALVTINSGGHLAPGASVGTLTMDRLTLAAGAVMDVELSSTTSFDKAKVEASDGLTIDGGAIALSGTISNGTYHTLLDYSGTLGGSVANLVVTSGLPAGRDAGLIDDTANTEIDMVVSTTNSDHPAWNVDASGNWSVAGNWLPIGVPNEFTDVTFGGFISADRTITANGSSKVVGSMTFDDGNRYTLSGAATLQLDVSGTVNPANINVNSGSHTIATPLEMLNPMTVTVTPAASTLTISGVISGTPALTKAGAGTLILSGANIYTSLTTISAGTLQVGEGGNAGSIAGNISNSAALVFDRAGTLTYSGVISGSGALTKRGAGTLTLSGTSTSAGNVDVTSGTLNVNNGNQFSADTLDVGQSGTGGLSQANFSGAATVLTLTANIRTGQGGNQGNITFNSGATANIVGLSITNSSQSTSASTVMVQGGAQVTTSATGNVTLGAQGEGQAALTVSGLGSIFDQGGSSGTLTVGEIGAGTATLTVGSGGTFSTSTGVTTINATGIIDVSGGTFNANGNMVFAGGTLRQTGGSFTLAAGKTITLNSPGGTFDIGNATTMTLGNAIAGASTLTKIGAGTLALSSTSNSYSGGTAINGGTLVISDNSNLGNTAAGVSFDSGTLNVTQTFSVSRAITLNNGGGTLDVASAKTLTLSGVISGTGELRKVGAGTLTLTGIANTYTGGTSIGGPLTIGNNNVIPNTGNVTLTNSASSVLNLNDKSDTIGALSGGGALGGNIVLGAGALTVSQITNTTYAGAISGSGSLMKSGGGTLILSGANTYTGATTVAAGKLDVQNNLTSSSSISVTGGTLELATGGGSNRVIKTGAVSTSAIGKVDLKDNKLIVTGQTLASVEAKVIAGRNGGAWNGSGITTSMSDASPASMLTTLAVAEAGVIGKTSLGGISVASDDVLVMYTYDGDADLTGFIDGDDFFRIDAGFTSALTGYANGDFNYSGNIDADDYFIIDRNYSRQGLPIVPSAPVGVTSVPEPAGVSAAGTALLLMRRRRQRHIVQRTMNA